MGDYVLYTSAAVVDLLSQIDELQGKTIDINETDNQAVITVDDTEYTIPYNNAVEVEVDDSVVDEVSEIIDSAYDDVNESAPDDITSGVLKELAKTLFVGGLVRLTVKLLK